MLIQVLLTGIPLAPGLFTITGCQVSAMGVSWMQPWLSRSAFLGQVTAEQAGASEQGGHAQVIVLHRLVYSFHCSGYGRPRLLDLDLEAYVLCRGVLVMADIPCGSVLPYTSDRYKSTLLC